MAKTKKINFPTPEYIDNWVDTYLDKHPNEKISDFKILEQKAEDEWWDKEIDKGNPTPFDLTEEQEKVAKKMTNTGTKKKTTNYDLKPRKRKVDTEKVDFIKKLFDFITVFVQNAEIVKPEREISFNIGENSYSLTLTKHRKPKN